MHPVRARLLREGWSAVVTPTARYEVRQLDELGEWAAGRIREAATRAGGAPVDVVTHSMGGLVLRASLAHNPPVRRVVMLSPPNEGAQMADHVRMLVPVHKLGWDPLAPLRPGVPRRLPTGEKDPVEIGVLAGARAGGGADATGFNPLLAYDNDGKVRVDEAILPGAKAFRVVRARHSLVMRTPAVLDEVVHFLRTGEFSQVPD